MLCFVGDLPNNVIYFCFVQGVTALVVCVFFDVLIFLSKRRSDSWQRLKFLIGRVLFLGLAAVVTIIARISCMGHNKSVPFSIQNNPAAHSEDWLTRALTFNYLLPLNVGKMVWPAPSNLCCDWSRGSIPLLTSWSDRRNLSTALFWTVLIWHSCDLLKSVIFQRSDRHEASVKLAGLNFQYTLFIKTVFSN